VTEARRILALWLPLLPVERLQRQTRTDDTADTPFVLIAKVDNAMHLSAADSCALRLGLRIGMALADARAMIPALVAVEADFAADAKLLAAIADWCERFSPFVALAPPHGLSLDVTGVAHLFGGEARMLAQIREEFRAQGFSLQLALAGTAAAAHALARHANGVIAAPGEDAQAVAFLPITGLGADSAVLHGLRRAGLKTIGQVAARARPELTARFGLAFVHLLDRVLGKACAPISPRTPLPACMAEWRFAEPVVTEEVIAATLLALATRLSEVLEKRGEGARAVEACFFRADGRMRRIGIETGRPTRDPAMLTRLLRERLDSLADPLDAGFGFDLIRLGAGRTQTLSPQATSFDDRESEQADIAALADRLAARFGAHNVLRAQPQDTHIPEAAAILGPAQHSIPRKVPWHATRLPGEAPRRPLRLFARAEPIEVMAQVPDGPPLRFRWRRALHRVAQAEGPERIAMEWWRVNDAQPTRDYFRVEDEEGHRFWLYRDGLYHRETLEPNWFVHGLFA
jgi:protein ImuB